jgi:hypothetical protein
MAVLLALTVFSGSCVNHSAAFTAPTTKTLRPTPTFASSSSSGGGGFSTTSLASTVVDSPTKEASKVEIIKENVTENEQKSGKNGWEIQLFNDPFNHRTFVAKCLCTICGKSDTESYQIMMQAHRNG